MNIEELKCAKCGSGAIAIRMAGDRISAYCKNCNSHIAYVSQKDVKEISKAIKMKNVGRGYSFKQFSKQPDGSYLVQCESCRCILHNSKAPKPIGQFDLIDAKFCPKCGLELF